MPSQLLPEPAPSAQSRLLMSAKPRVSIRLSYQGTQILYRVVLAEILWFCLSPTSANHPTLEQFLSDKSPLRSWKLPPA